MELVIRPAAEADLVQVAEIYAWETVHSVATFDTEPRPLSVWQHKLTEPFVVAVEDDRVLGYAYGTQFRDRPAYHRSYETSVYVHRDAQGRRLGKQLYDVLLPRLRGAGIHTALALIALPNDPSVRLHLACGFGHVGTLQEVGDKHGRLIDVGIYQAML